MLNDVLKCAGRFSFYLKNSENMKKGIIMLKVFCWISCALGIVLPLHTEADTNNQGSADIIAAAKAEDDSVYVIKTAKNIYQAAPFFRLVVPEEPRFTREGNDALFRGILVNYDLAVNKQLSDYLKKESGTGLTASGLTHGRVTFAVRNMKDVSITPLMPAEGGSELDTLGTVVEFRFPAEKTGEFKIHLLKKDLDVSVCVFSAKDENDLLYSTRMTFTDYQETPVTVSAVYLPQSDFKDVRKKMVLMNRGVKEDACGCFTLKATPGYRIIPQSVCIIYKSLEKYMTDDRFGIEPLVFNDDLTCFTIIPWINGKAEDNSRKGMEMEISYTELKEGIESKVVKKDLKQDNSLILENPLTGISTEIGMRRCWVDVEYDNGHKKRYGSFGKYPGIEISPDEQNNVMIAIRNELSKVIPPRNGNKSDGYLYVKSGGDDVYLKKSRVPGTAYEMYPFFKALISTNMGDTAPFQAKLVYWGNGLDKNLKNIPFERSHDKRFWNATYNVKNMSDAKVDIRRTVAMLDRESVSFAAANPEELKKQILAGTLDVDVEIESLSGLSPKMTFDIDHGTPVEAEVKYVKNGSFRDINDTFSLKQSSAGTDASETFTVIAPEGYRIDPETVVVSFEGKNIPVKRYGYYEPFYSADGRTAYLVAWIVGDDQDTERAELTLRISGRAYPIDVDANSMICKGKTIGGKIRVEQTVTGYNWDRMTLIYTDGYQKTVFGDGCCDGFNIAFAGNDRSVTEVSLINEVRIAGGDYVQVNPGSFVMGSPKEEYGRSRNEEKHEVVLTREYFIGKYEVTQALYKSVIGENPAVFKGENNPVENVTWDEAVQFCEELTKRAHLSGALSEEYIYTLPTEAQWEYACRAGTTTVYNDGVEIDGLKGEKSSKEYVTSQYSSALTQLAYYNSVQAFNSTLPVGKKQANNWGIHDMHGNVNEWCLDQSSQFMMLTYWNSIKDPLCTTGEKRIARGGSYNDVAVDCRSSSRKSYAQKEKNGSLGFRVIITTVPRVQEGLLPEMVYIPSGNFMMGKAGYLPEKQHKVIFPKAFWIGKYEVSQGLWRQIMGEEPENYSDDSLPVSGVRWSAALELCARLTEYARNSSLIPEGYEFTLPTEAQWEYACRAEGGVNDLREMVNQRKGIDPVGSNAPNSWGLYNMRDNVREWCLDHCSGNSLGTADTRTYRNSIIDPLSLDGDMRVLRGGYYSSGKEYLTKRLCDRDGEDNLYKDYYGFRLALSQVRPEQNFLSEMVYVAPIPFFMGSKSGEIGRFENEKYHMVTLTDSFWISKYEVTQGLYESVMKKNPVKEVSKNGPGVGSKYPVYFVSWNDAMEFCAELTRIEKAAGRLLDGYEYTLPTEAQWECSCRAVDTELRDEVSRNSKYKPHTLDEIAWYYKPGKNNNIVVHPVGKKLPNLLDLFDMQGNLMEWCMDRCRVKNALADTSTYKDEIQDPLELEGNERIIRGGSYSDEASCVRPAYRGHKAPNERSKEIGFRIVLTRKR